jgi:FixJ family two-component response regulator
MQLVAIVDDDEVVRSSVKDVLDHAGFSTAAFPSAESFLQSDRLTNVACLVTDLSMPGMTGLELHQQLLAANHAIPAILMTGCAEDEVRREALQSRVAAYLAKPFHTRELLACIRSAIEASQADDGAAPDSAHSEHGGTQ